MVRPSDPGQHVYFTRSHPVGGVLFGLIFGGIAIATAAVNFEKTGTVIFNVVLLLATVAFAYRFARARAIASPDGLHVINLMGSFDLDWEEIDRFEIGRWKLLPAVCLIRLRNGETSHIYGIEENYFLSGESGRRMVDELNAELSEYRGSAAATQDRPPAGAQDALFRAPGREPR
jgi:hypothetical protein